MAPEPGSDLALDSQTGQELARLVAIVDRLLGPGGCPWDQEQTHETLKRHLLEECYEVFDAIDSGDPDKLREELGDLLLQPIMHAQMEARDGRFSSRDVAASICEKLIRRHPHVFGPLRVEDADEVLRNWDRIKQEEKSGEPASILEGVPKSLPALHRAFEVSKRAARVGFEWPDLDAVFAKLDEEVAELKEAIRQSASPLEGEVGERSEPGEGEGPPPKPYPHFGEPKQGRGSSDAIAAEIGDLLFTAVNIARWTGVEPEEALRQMVLRFESRFRAMEVATTKPLRELSPKEWDGLWERAKSAEASFE
ncbi:MAG: nucleoside triphosphate pyrophosphohydrolase [Armatimonadetes bacterium]|nr:nucleoside triphosphate pyrophosphohydrolase [Armatimonadota bacterium]